jgi:hypothetical protein
MGQRSLWYAVAVLAGCVLGLILPAQAQRGGGGGGAVGTPISATYKGLTTNRAYQPLPTAEPGPAGADGQPTVITTRRPPIHVEPITEQIRRDYAGRGGAPLSTFYTKMLTIRGVLVVGSDKVSDWAFLEAAYTLDHVFRNSPKWVTDGFASTKVHLAIIADVEYTMDLPENANMGNGAYNDRRSRGLGGFPWCSCAEENLLNLPRDPYGGNGQQGSGENITIHEFTHTTGSMIRSIQRIAGTRADGAAAAPVGTPGRMGRGRDPEGSWGARMDAAFAKSTSPGGRLYLYNQEHGGQVYASNDWQEFWAEGAQAWFDNANPRNSGDLSVRDDVKTKDPDLAALLKEIYGDGEWRYIKTTAKKPDGTPLRPPADFEHLVGLDELRPQFPVFNFNNSPRIIAAATQGDGAAAGPARGGGRGRGTATAPTTTRPTGM